MNKLSFNRKGSLLDLIVFMGMAFALSLACVIMFYIANTTHEALLDSAPQMQGIMTSHNATTIIEDTFGHVPSSFQSLKWITSMLIFGMILSIIVSCLMVKAHPVFFIPYLLVTIISIIISVPISNAYGLLKNNAILSSSFEGFLGQNFIFANLPIWITIIGLIGGIFLYINISGSNDGY